MYERALNTRQSINLTESIWKLMKCSLNKICLVLRRNLCKKVEVGMKEGYADYPHYFAHLSTKYLEWAIVITHCLSTSIHWNFFFISPTQSWLLTILKKEPFENIKGKGENAGNQHFLLFPECFLSYSIKGRNDHFSSIWFVVCNCFQFGPIQQICRFVKS